MDESSLAEGFGRLFHYTSLKNLALILEATSIRFSSLELLNDATEGSSSGPYRAAARWVLVSCWTEAKEESIPLWQLYTPDMSGCRLSLPADSIFDYRAKEGHRSAGLIGPTRMLYTDDPAVLAPSIHREYEEDFNSQNYPELEFSVTLDLSPLGIAKPRAWSFEREVRFRFLPRGSTVVAWGSYSGWHRDRVFEELAQPTTEPFADIPLCQDALRELVVRLGPRADRSHQVIASSLLERYAPEAKLEQSDLRIR